MDLRLILLIAIIVALSGWAGVALLLLMLAQAAARYDGLGPSRRARPRFSDQLVTRKDTPVALTSVEKDKQLMEAIRAFRQVTYTYEALIRVARELFTTEEKTARVYIRRERQSWNARFGWTVVDGKGLRDVIIRVGDDR